ncbi:MAG: TMEM165/GDT1 family protein [Natronospirillum sp.]|uniref:TMEM165/GDT1 family protein n=1 Tax=Natronospirillum sp. TaxID=2812955 RepID=UPI0025CE8521|nr:TMEM165/GDT1 family protein [Natronospirillum sp.]MCH8553246.1 TMEM165/GDT1 family protein [Natronospirillum sp.]
MDAFLVSTLAISIAEIGDRSLLLALLLGIRYRRPWPVFWGMVLGLFANQLLSALVGLWLFSLLPPLWQPWLIAAVFLLMAVWLLFEEDDEVPPVQPGLHLLLGSALAFFLLEMADKTQVTVIALMGAYGQLVPVVLGATLGILLVTTPALWLGNKFADRIPSKTVHRLASLLFLLLALWIVADALGWLPNWWSVTELFPRLSAPVRA